MAVTEASARVGLSLRVRAGLGLLGVSERVVLHGNVFGKEGCYGLLGVFGG